MSDPGSGRSPTRPAPLFDPNEVRDLVRLGQWRIEHGREEKTWKAVATALSISRVDAHEEIEKALTTLSENTFHGRYEGPDHPPSDEHGLYLGKCGFYIKLRIESVAKSERVLVISFHPPDHEPLVTRGGDRIVRCR